MLTAFYDAAWPRRRRFVIVRRRCRVLQPTLRALIVCLPIPPSSILHPSPFPGLTGRLIYYSFKYCYNKTANVPTMLCSKSVQQSEPSHISKDADSVYETFPAANRLNEHSSMSLSIVL